MVFSHDGNSVGTSAAAPESGPIKRFVQDRASTVYSVTGNTGLG